MFVATDPGAEPYDPPDGDNIGEWVDEMTRRGIWILGRPPAPAGGRDGPCECGVARQLITDGPFTESKEWIAGFDVIECADWDEAIEVASKHPMARFGRHRAASRLAAGSA